MMKKILILSIALVMSFLLILPVSVSAAAYSAYDGTWNWYYSDTAANQKIMLSGYWGTKTNLTVSDIPNALDANINSTFATPFDSTALGKFASLEPNIGTPENPRYAVESIVSFDYAANTTTATKSPTLISSIDLPYGPIIIGGYCFRAQSALTQIFMPDSITTVDLNVFHNATSLGTVVMSANITTIGASCFLATAPTLNLYFRSTTPPTSIGGTLTTNGRTVNVYIPSTGNSELDESNKTAYSTAFTGKFGTGTITYATYTSLPEDAEKYYYEIGSGITPAPEPDEITNITLKDDGDTATTNITAAATVESVTVKSKTSTEGILVMAFFDNKNGLIKAAAQNIVSSDYSSGSAVKTVNWAVPSGTLSAKTMFWNFTSAKPLTGYIENPSTP